MSVGKIGQFDLEKDNWDFYVDRLDQYFVANNVKTELKVATLITVMGNDAYELLVHLCTPAKPATKTYTELVTIMKGHLNPKPSMLAERFKFRQRIQKNEESIANYVTVLEKLSKDCGFPADSLKENLRDQFVCGLASDDIRQKLFTEDDNITFDRAYKLAVSMEAAEANAALVDDCTRNRNGDSVPYTGTTSVHQVGRVGRERADSGTQRAGRGRSQPAGGSGGSGGMRALRGQTRGSISATSGAGAGAVDSIFQSGRNCNNPYRNNGSRNVECKVCGAKHDPDSCKFKLYVCRVCNREGHLKRMCPKLLRNSTLHNVDEEQVVYNMMDKDDSIGSDEVNNFSLDSNEGDLLKPYTINVSIDGTMLSMEIDTGSAISCISKELYERMFQYCKIHDSKLIIRYYTGERIKPVGKITPIVTYNNISKKLDLYIVECGKTSLLGRCWMRELCIDLSAISCYKINESNVCFNISDFSSRYCEVFADGLGRFTGGTVGFHLREGARPMFLRARPLAYALREPVERALDQLVRDGVITPVTTSDWATPIVPVMKKDGTIRVCADFKLTLNRCLEVDHYPLPKVEDLLTKLHGGEKFTKLDLSQAYAQFELDDSKKYTVINTHKGMFMYNRLVYGLSSTPGIFQRKLEQLFADMPRVGVFLDDLIITGVDNQMHLATLHEVFERLQKYGLKIRKDKCTFFADSVTYLGFVISKKGVHACQEKVDAIANVAVPTNVSELRSFLGLVMYYAKFIPNISTILAPLYSLLRKEVKYEWSESCLRAFNKVKNMMMSSKVLAHYSPELPLVLTTDASGVGVGAVISHLMPDGGERPVAYASRSLNAAERAYSQIDREALAIIYGVKKFHQYLYGRRFILRTDHKPLVTIFGDKTGIPVMAASRMQRWAVILAGYDYSIEYVRSEKNAADALSRLPVKQIGEGKRTSDEATYLNFIQKILPVTRKIVQDQVAKDELLKKVYLFVQSGWPSECKEENMKPYFTRRSELYLDRGCIVWGYRLVIPGSLRMNLLKELHIGHPGIVKMKSIARSYVWWPGIDNDIESACKQCTTCAIEGAAPPRAPPQPWQHIAEPWSRLHVDFLGPFHGRTFLVIIDSTSKWLEVFTMQRTTASSIIKVMRETFARFGLPKEVVSDNGPPFTSKEYLDFMTINGVKVTFTAIYHPASNGAAENAVKLCKRAMKKSIRDGCNIDVALQTYLLMYRNLEHSSTGTSPAMLLQRRNLRSRLDLLREERQVELKVTEAQEKQVHNAGGTSRTVKVGDEVWARDYTGGKWVKGQVESKLGSRNYVIGREGGGPSIKRHIDQIKKRRSSYGVPSTEPVGSSPIKGTGNDSVPTIRAKVDSSRAEVVSPRTEVSSPTKSGEEPRVLEPVVERVESPKGMEVPEPPIAQSKDTHVSPVARPKRVRIPVKRFGFDFD